MTTHNDDRLDGFITAYILYLDGEGPQPDLADLNPDDRAEAAARIRLLEAAAPAEVLDGAVDRISRSLGFDRAGTRITLSGARFKRRRQDLGLDLKTIAAQATAAGVTVRTSDLLKLETAGALPFEQEVATVLVAILDTTLENIEDEFEREMTTVQAFLNGPRFEEVLAGWLDEHANQDPREVRAYVTDGVLAANFRAEDVSEEHLVDFVRALLRKLAP